MSRSSGGGTLFVVGTPIGNLDDMTTRATATLRSVAVCYAEDTRRTGRLFAHLDIGTALRSLHAHNEEERRDEILDRLASGADVGLVSDSGTPTVSDPGRRVVAAALEAGATVTPIPGASAVPAALSASGLPADRFHFAGFAPRKGTAREDWFGEVLDSSLTVVMFEAPRRLEALLDELSERGGGDRRAVVCRELTKLHEEIRAGTIDELATVYRGRTVKGEVTLVMAGGGEPVEEIDDARVAAAIEEMRSAAWSRRRIADELKERFGLTRNEAYRRSLEVDADD